MRAGDEAFDRRSVILAAPLRMAVALLGLMAACAPATGASERSDHAEEKLPAAAGADAAAPQSGPASSTREHHLQLSGEMTQGGFIRGQVAADTRSLSLDGLALPVGADGRFFAAFDRDAGREAELTIIRADGSQELKRLSIAPRAWNIEHINVARRSGGASEAWWKKREPEWLAIKGAREKITGATGWQQEFIWPVKGRISGRFGSQRIYRGEPASYHSGLDIAPGAGKPFVAPADGVVVLAARNFSLEGNLLIIDHGQGLNSAFLHASRLLVSEGDRVTQGQHIGNVGSSGRATGPHLHWSLKWRDARLDPLLFVPAQ